MGTQRTSFEKLQRDRAKKAKAAAKREKRFDKDAPAPTDEELTAPLLRDDGKPLSPAELLTLVETIHRQFEDGQIDIDTFEERKAELFARLPVD